ncbi:unnamed protein product [Gadus morhua 'NCC']
MQRAAPVSLQPSTAPLALYPHNAPGEHTPDCPGRASPSGGRVRVTPPGMMEGQDSLKSCVLSRVHSDMEGSLISPETDSLLAVQAGLSRTREMFPSKKKRAAEQEVEAM